MAKVHEALKRIEWERQGQMLAASAVSRPAERVEQEERLSWKRWFGRALRVQQPTSPNAMSLEHAERVAAMLGVLEKHVSATLPNRLDAVLLERMEMIATRFDELDDRVSKAIGGAEQLLPALEARLTALERELVTRLGDVTDRLSERTVLWSTRITALLVIIALTLLGILVRL